MAIKTFSVNEVLTAADTNTYLANAGYVTLATKTVSNNNELTFYSSLSATYLNYLIVGNLTAAGTTEIRLQLASGNTPNQTTGYRYFQAEMTANPVSSGLYDNKTFFYVSNGANVAANSTGFQINLYAPQATGRTLYRSSTIFEWVSDVTYYREVSGRFNGTTQFDGFRVFSDSANMTGTVSLYGMRVQ